VHPEEAEAVRQHLEVALAEEEAVGARLLLHDLLHELSLLELAEALELELLRDLGQPLDGHGLKGAQIMR